MPRRSERLQNDAQIASARMQATEQNPRALLTYYWSAASMLKIVNQLPFSDFEGMAKNLGIPTTHLYILKLMF